MDLKKVAKEGVDVKASFIEQEDVENGVIVPTPKLSEKTEEVVGPLSQKGAHFDPHLTTTPNLVINEKFDPSMVTERIEKMWKLNAEFGKEILFSQMALAELLTDRYTLINGFQLIRDELQFAGIDGEKRVEHESGIEMSYCGADCTIPSVVSTLAYTNCGDRFNSEVHSFYQNVVSTRFATISELGSLKTEAFYPTGGGTDDGKTFAHVTVAHMLNDSLKKAVYEKNKFSYSLVNFDLFTHCGKSSDASHVMVGLASESEWRDERAACGALVGCLKAFNPNNPVHKRLRSDLGEANFEILTKNDIFLDNGFTKINYLVAAAIVAIQGMKNTAVACKSELDERGVAHLTATVALNKKSTDKGLFVMYFGRAIVFQDKITIQSFGTDASKYSGILVRDGNRSRVQLFYDGKLQIPIETLEV